MQTHGGRDIGAKKQTKCSWKFVLVHALSGFFLNIKLIFKHKVHLKTFLAREILTVLETSDTSSIIASMSLCFQGFTERKNCFEPHDATASKPKTQKKVKQRVNFFLFCSGFLCILVYDLG